MKRMKRRVRMSAVLLAVLLIAALASGVSASAASAGEYEPLTVELPYKHKYTTNDTTVDSLFHYIIEVVDGNGSLPAEADENGVFTYEGTSGAGTTSGGKTVYDLQGTLTFTFTKPGEYTYLVRADFDTDNQKTHAERYYFEARQYTVRFYIANETDGSLRLRMLTAEEDGGIKPNDVELDPTYEGPLPTPAPTPTTPPSVKTGDGAAIGQYMLLMLSSALMTAILTVRMRRGKTEK